MKVEANQPFEIINIVFRNKDHFDQLKKIDKF